MTYAHQMRAGSRMSDRWPPIRTHIDDLRGYEMGHAASIGLAAVLIGLPLLGLGLSWLMENEADNGGSGLSVYSVAQMMAYSPLVSWMGLILGIPLVYTAIRRGFGGWLVTMAIGALVGMVVLLATVWLALEVTGLRIALIGATFGGVFAGVYWLTMRLTTPALFRRPQNRA